MSAKKKKYNCRFPPARIKKIMQADEEVGKVAAVVPLIISRALELFVESLLTESSKITKSRNARTLTPSHLKACITSNSQFSFLRDFVSTIPDIQSVGEDGEQSDGGNSSTGNNNHAPSHHHHHPHHYQQQQQQQPHHLHHQYSNIQGSTSTGHIVSSLITSSSSSSSLIPSSTISSAATIASSAFSSSYSGINLTRQSSTSSRTSSRSTNSCSIRTTVNRGRGRPRKVNITSSRSQEDEEDGEDEEDNDINETSRNVKSNNRSRRDEDDDDETTEDDDEGSSCDDSSSNASRAQPNPPLHNQINSFTIALNQQVEDDDYDN